MTVRVAGCRRISPTRAGPREEIIARVLRGRMNGLIFELTPLPVHDGPGIRSTLFLKGCPLRCPWYQNLEACKSRPAVAEHVAVHRLRSCCA